MFSVSLTNSKIFYTHPDMPWRPTSALYIEHQVTFPGKSFNYLPPCSVEKKMWSYTSISLSTFKACYSVKYSFIDTVYVQRRMQALSRGYN